MAILKDKKNKTFYKLSHTWYHKLPARWFSWLFHKKWLQSLRILTWFSLGAILGFFFFISFLFISYRKSHQNLIYSGIIINGVDFGGKTKDEVREYFVDKNKNIQSTKIILESPESSATISAKQLSFGYNADLLAQQAFSVGRSSNTMSNMSLIVQAYLDGVHLSPSYRYREDRLNELIKNLKKEIEIKPIDAIFSFENGKVVTFRFSKEGKTIDAEGLKKEIYAELSTSPSTNAPQAIKITIPVVQVQPAVSDNEANKLGIKELIAEGSSYFHHSIENRIFNLNMAASRLNGTLIPPDQVFSFTKTLGDVSSFTGYKQAYVIENGKTVLGDGGGICQVSTTLFRAALNAGLPIIERHAHAYRVGYYEQDSPPGIDAAIYSPSIDLRFKNDTGHHILVQSYADLNQQRLVFQLYGTKDNREVTVNKPILLSESPAPDTLYQDDPTLPKGQLKQVDFAAGGANVYFTRIVKKDGKVVLSDKFSSNYKPWQAIFLRGTKE